MTMIRIWFLLILFPVQPALALLYVLLSLSNQKLKYFTYFWYYCSEQDLKLGNWIKHDLINKLAYAWTLVLFPARLDLTGCCHSSPCWKNVFAFEDLGERGPLPPLQASFQMPVKIPSKASSQEPVQEFRTKRDYVLFQRAVVHLSPLSQLGFSLSSWQMSMCWIGAQVRKLTETSLH